MPGLTTPAAQTRESGYLFYDDFSAKPDAVLAGKSPVVGSYAWQTTGAGVAGERVASGKWSSTTAGFTYAVAHLDAAPWEIGCEFSSADGTGYLPILACLKDYDTYAFDVMWHPLINAGTPASSYFSPGYWDTVANGGSAVTNQAPTWQTPRVEFAIEAGVRYVYRVVFNAPWVDLLLEKADGTPVACYRTYEPRTSAVIGPWFFIEVSGDADFGYHKAWARSKPAQDSKTYRRVKNGIEATPIGDLYPAGGNFTHVHAGSGQPKGVFSARYNGTAADIPGVYSLQNVVFKVQSEVSGYTASLQLIAGAGYVGTMEMDGSAALNFKGQSGTTFLTKPANAGLPYFAGPIGVTASSVPADADVPTGKVFWWFDSTNGAAKVMFKGKSANGTVVTASVALA